MIVFHPAQNCPHCAELREKLSSRHLAFRTDTKDKSLPAHALKDGDELIEGHESVEQRIEELAGMLDKSRRYQSDVCHDYGDEE